MGKKIRIFLILFLVGIRGTLYADTICVGEGKDCTSITQALDAAADGDEIIISGGVYDESVETFPIETEKCLYIHAAPGETVTIKSPLTKTTMKLKGAGSKMEGIGLEFTRAAGLHILGDHIVLENCRIALGDIEWRETSCGLWIGGAKHVTIRNTEFVNSSIAIAGPPVDAPRSDVPVLTALFEVGEDLEFFTTHTIENTTVNGRQIDYVVGLKDQEYTSDCGEVIAIGCENVTFRNLDVSNASIGFQLAYSSNCTVTDTEASDSGIFGIYLAKCDNCCITDINANNGSHGIDLRDCDLCLVENCTSNDSGQGIFLSWSRDCDINHCRMCNNGTGFFAFGGGNIQVDSCCIEGNELGLYIQKQRFTLTDSEVNANTSCGLRTTDSETTVQNNLFQDNLVGSLALNSTYALYSGNTFTGNSINDLYFKNCTDVEYNNNDFLSVLEENVVIK